MVEATRRTIYIVGPPNKRHIWDNIIINSVIFVFYRDCSKRIESMRSAIFGS